MYAGPGMYLLLKRWHLGRNMKVHTARSIKSVRFMAGLKPGNKRSPCCNKLSCHTHLLKCHPASCTINIYTAKYLSHLDYCHLRSWKGYKQASDAYKGPGLPATSFASCYFCQLNPLDLELKIAVFKNKSKKKKKNTVQ